MSNGLQAAEGDAKKPSHREGAGEDQDRGRMKVQGRPSQRARQLWDPSMRNKHCGLGPHAGTSSSR